MKRLLYIVASIGILLSTSCKKEELTEQAISSNNNPVITTDNTYLYKTVLIGTYNSVAYDSITGAINYNIDSLPVTNTRYYRLTSKFNVDGNYKAPQYVTEFYVDSTSTLQYGYINWFDYLTPSQGTTYGRTSEGWLMTFYYNTGTANNYIVKYYFKEDSHIVMSLPPTL